MTPGLLPEGEKRNDYFLASGCLFRNFVPICESSSLLKQEQTHLYTHTTFLYVRTSISMLPVGFPLHILS